MGKGCVAPRHARLRAGRYTSVIFQQKFFKTMTAFTSFRRLAALAVLGASSALLVACGSSSVASALDPARILSVGDGFSDVGQSAGGMKATVNDGSKTWPEYLAEDYGLQMKPANAGGLSWAQAYARVDAPDTSGHNAPSIRQQVDSLLAHSKLTGDDVVLINAGVSEIVAQVSANGTGDAAKTAIEAAGRIYGAQIRRLVKEGGAKHVLAVGVYNMGHTPWARAQGEDAAKAITNLSVAFNYATIGEIVDLGDTNAVLFIDPSLLFNLIYNEPDDYGLKHVDEAACTTPDALTCTADTLKPGADLREYMFADGVHITPRMHERYGHPSQGEGATYQLRRRW